MKVVLLSLCLSFALAFPEADYARIQFAKFQSEHGKVYQTKSEHSYRFKVFSDNLQKINAHNKAGHSYKLGNLIEDLTYSNFYIFYYNQPNFFFQMNTVIIFVFNCRSEPVH